MPDYQPVDLGPLCNAGSSAYGPAAQPPVGQVSFHGLPFLIGGAAPDPLKRVMQAVIAFAVAGTGLSVEIAGMGDPLDGADEANIVNRLTMDQHNGIQIEQQRQARFGTIPDTNLPRWQAIAAAVTDVYRVILTSSADPH